MNRFLLICLAVVCPAGFMTAVARSAEPQDSFVVVERLKRSEVISRFSGIVIYRDENFAYALTDLGRANDQPEFTLRAHKVGSRAKSTASQPGKLVRIPARAAPDALPQTMPRVTVGDSVRVLSLVVQNVKRPPGDPHPKEVKATVKRIYYDLDGRLTSILITGLRRDLEFLSGPAMVVTEDGGVVGVIGYFVERPSRKTDGHGLAARQDKHVTPIRYLAALRSGRIIDTKLTPLDWGQHGVSILFQAWIEAPFDFVEQREVLMRRAGDNGTPQILRAELEQVDPKVRLKNTSLQAFKPTHQAVLVDPRPLTDAKPLEFEAVVGKVSDNGRKLLRTPNKLWLDPDDNSLARPSASDMAALGLECQFRPQGGISLRFAGDDVAPTQVNEPDTLGPPKLVSEDGPAHRIDRVLAERLSFRTGRHEPYQVIWSRDSQAMYVSDGSKICRFRASDTRHTHTLTVPNHVGTSHTRDAPRFLIFESRAGIVLRTDWFDGTNVLWILAPATLTVRDKIVIPAYGKFLPCKSDSNLVFLVGSGTCVIDLEKGKVVRHVHAIGGYERRNRDLDVAFATPDGNHLVLGRFNALVRIDIEDDEWILRERIEQQPLGFYFHYVMGDSSGIWRRPSRPIWSRSTGEPLDVEWQRLSMHVKWRDNTPPMSFPNVRFEDLHVVQLIPGRDAIAYFTSRDQEKGWLALKILSSMGRELVPTFTVEWPDTLRWVQCGYAVSPDLKRVAMWTESRFEVFDLPARSN